MRTGAMTAARSTAHTRPMRAASVVGVVVIALGLVGCTRSGPGTTAPPLASGSAQPSMAAAQPSTTGAQAPTAAAQPATGAASAKAGAHGYAVYPAADFPAGMYATRAFQPAFRAEIDTDLGLRYGGDEDRFVFIGQDKNASVNADEEWDVMYLDRVLDPVGQRTIEPLDGNPLEWFEQHPRLEVISRSATDLEVDEHPAHQLDLLPADPVQCGSQHQNLQRVLIGYGPPNDEPFVVFAGSRFRVVVVDFDGTPILFTYQAADDARFADRSGVFDRWVRSVDFQ
jgi:hypothetical protein